MSSEPYVAPPGRSKVTRGTLTIEKSRREKEKEKRGEKITNLSQESYC